MALKEAARSLGFILWVWVSAGAQMRKAWEKALSRLVAFPGFGVGPALKIRQLNVFA